MPVPKLEEFKAPWETADGKDIPDEEQVIDKDRLKRFIHGLLSDKDRLQASVTAVTGERDTLKTEMEQKKREGESEEARIKRENEELRQKLEDASKTSVETMKLRAALKAGLGEEHVGRLIGSTQEELDSDAETLKKSFGSNGKSEEKDTPRGRPRPVRTPGDPDPEAGNDISTDKALELIPRPYDI